jgi:hypothetical protein
MDVVWTALFVAVCAATGGLVIACERWLAPRSKPLR